MADNPVENSATINKKVCLLGDFGVGKTSLVRRFVYERFEDKYLSTIGVKISRKAMSLSYEGKLIDLTIILWDLAGSEEFNQFRASYLRGASGIMLVCDLTRPETLHHLPSYLGDMRQVCPVADIILAANKADLKDEQRLSTSEIETFAGGLNIPYYLTSAKSGDRVETIFRHLGQLMMARQF
jgi:small GTP-binding protein